MTIKIDSLEAPDIRPHKRWQSGLMSLALHVAILVLAALVWSLVPQTVGGGGDTKVRRGEIVLANLEPTKQNFEYETSDSSQSTKSDSSSQPPALPTTAPPAVTPATQPAPDTPGPAIDISDLNAGKMDQLRSSTQLQKSLSAEDLAAIAKEQQQLRSRRPPGPIVNAKLFGSGNIPGRRFVFLIDRSSSMGEKGLGVLHLAETQLEQAISELTDENYFQVLAYHDHATVIGERDMLPATSENKKKVREFVGGLSAFGSTQHEAGLYAAISLRPDVIVWLTDGGYPELNDGQIQAFCGASGKQVAVHAFQFGSIPQPPSRSFMKTMATETGGTYTYIDVSEWKAKGNQ